MFIHLTKNLGARQSEFPANLLVDALAMLVVATSEDRLV
jgi:hypothetical protein